MREIKYVQFNMVHQELGQIEITNANVLILRPHTNSNGYWVNTVLSGNKMISQVWIDLDKYNKIGIVDKFMSAELPAVLEGLRKRLSEEDTVFDRAIWWITNGRVGASSKTIWSCMMGSSEYSKDYPHDSADFGRCYALLQLIPEWRHELHRLKPLGRSWSNLVDNWDRLTEMYERNVSENWKNAKSIGMYELIRELVC